MTQPPLRRHDLWQHQCHGYRFGMERPAALMAMGLGTGKTATSIAIADNIDAQRVLVLCPSTCRSVWRREIPKHSARDVWDVVLDQGSIKRRTALANFSWGRKQPVYVVANYESCLYDPFRSWCLSREWDAVILDESQKVQAESKTARFCELLRPKAKRRYALSATPLTQDPMSVFAQCRFIDPAVFGTDYDAFEYKYNNRFIVGARKAALKLLEIYAQRGWKPFVIPEHLMSSTSNTEEYLERLARIAIRIENAVLNLPPLTIEKRTFRLSDSARSVYEGIQAGYGYEIETGRWMDVPGSYAVTMRLQQITSGWLPDDKGDVVPLDGGKDACLTELLAEAGGEPVVVFCRFVRDLDIVRDASAKLGLRYGEISQRRKDALTNLAEMTPGLQVCGVQEASGGAGIDLSRARICIDYSPSWSLQTYDQKIARLHRPPAKLPVVCYQLIAEDTIDEEIHRALVARRQVIGKAWSGLSRTTSPPSPSPLAGTAH